MPASGRIDTRSIKVRFIGMGSRVVGLNTSCGANVKPDIDIDLETGERALFEQFLNQSLC